jgi:hypothetical protein
MADQKGSVPPASWKPPDFTPFYDDVPLDLDVRIDGKGELVRATSVSDVHRLVKLARDGLADSLENRPPFVPHPMHHEALRVLTALHRVVEMEANLAVLRRSDVEAALRELANMAAALSPDAK